VLEQGTRMIWLLTGLAESVKRGNLQWSIPVFSKGTCHKREGIDELQSLVFFFGTQ